jgi:hypothetical protein
MDSTIITAGAAALGSLVGAAASITTTWITQRTQTIREHTEARLRERELLYGEFITEASRLAVDALNHSLEQPDKLVTLYGILGRIRLVASERVLAEAERCCRRIVGLYMQPNLTTEQIRSALETENLDPLKAFSDACRAEFMGLPLLRDIDPLLRGSSSRC